MDNPPSPPSTWGFTKTSVIWVPGYEINNNNKLSMTL